MRELKELHKYKEYRDGKKIILARITKTGFKMAVMLLTMN
jgi:hypothetical protein